MDPSRQPRKTFSLEISPKNRGIYGELDIHGEVTFIVVAGEGASIRGTRLFDIMMDAFGEEAKTIRGAWRKGPHGKPSVNIDKVNELTAAGVPLEEAVACTWTITRARRRGFDEFRVEVCEGNAGAFTKIEVVIKRKEM